MRRALVTLTTTCTLFSNVIFASSAALPSPQSTQADRASLPAPAVSPYKPFPASAYRVYPIVRSDSVMGQHLLHIQELDADGSYAHPYEPVMDKGMGQLPVPEKLVMSPRKLSLADAIALALRNNPQVEISELQRILDKFSMEVAIHDNYGIQWQPFTLSGTIQNQAYPTWQAGGGFNVLTPVGTQFSLATTNNLLGGMGSTVLTMTQPLMQNFGFAYNRIAYENALDNEKVARLNFKGSVMNVVVDVITNYHSLVQQYNSLDQDKKSLASQEENYKQNELQVKIGKMAPSELIQQKQNLESTKLTVVQQENTLRVAYLSFLSSLGLIPTARLTINRHISIDQENHVPALKKCIAIALRHNVSYRSALINLDITKRALISAENARKWTLNLVSSVTEGSQRGGMGQPIQNIGTNPTVAVNLSVPIDNIQLKQGVVSAKVGIENAKLTLQQQKQNLVLQIMNQWDSIHNQYEQIEVSKSAIDLQEQTLRNEKLKLKYGKSSVFEVNTLETNLLTQQVNLISTEISYLNAITALYQTMGTTLDRWNIKLRY